MRIWMRTGIVFALVVVCALVALSGCRPPPRQRDYEGGADAQPTPLPGLLGTWSATYEDWEDDERLGTFVDTLTFTTERYILHRAHYSTEGTFRDHWAQSGTWNELGEGSLERIWKDAEQTFKVSKRLPLGLQRNVLYMDHWLDESRPPTRRLTGMSESPSIPQC